MSQQVVNFGQQETTTNKMRELITVRSCLNLTIASYLWQCMFVNYEV